jgi:hypothetical protein
MESEKIAGTLTFAGIGAAAPSRVRRSPGVKRVVFMGCGYAVTE